METQWNTIPNHPDYQASTAGQIRRIEDGKVLKLYTLPNGYLIASLKLSSKKHKVFLVHRLIAQTFLQKIEGKTEINHLDGNKTNNSVSNIEFCTHKENIQHAMLTGLINKAEVTERYRQMGLSNKGRVLTEEHKAKISSTKRAK